MSFKQVFVFVKKYFSTEKKQIIKGLFFIFVSSLIGILYGYLIGLSFDNVVNKSYKIALLVLSLNLILNLIDSIFLDRLGRIFIEKSANNMLEQIGKDVFDKVGKLPARAFEEKTSGEFINRITSDSSTIATTYKHLLRTVITLFSSFLVFVYIFANSWIIGFEIVGYIIIVYIISKIYLNKIEEKEKNITKDKDKMTSSVNEIVHGIREIRALGIRKKANNMMNNLASNVYKELNKQMVDEYSYNAFITSINLTLEFVVFVTCIILIILGKATYAFFMSLTYYIYRFMGTVDNISELGKSYKKMKVAVERISEILDNKLYNDEKFGEVEKINIKGNIEFKNVCFKYPNEEIEIFKNFNLNIPTGKKIAIVGKSGQGKTTIFNLLLRYFDVDSGVISIDDIPIQDFTENTLRKKIAIIRQDPFIFNKTILENLQMVDDNASINDIREACKFAQIDDYIMSLPKKYDTMIGEGGINLSGGQKQRLAIARALLKNSKIILFDEATSALDNENQAKIKNVIDDLVKDHTIIIVAHRLSTIIDADIIYLIDHGKVVDKGTHKSLLRKNKMYKSLYNNEK